jgi:branched-chain amino acid transport system substrate-binding protein
MTRVVAIGSVMAVGAMLAACGSSGSSGSSSSSGGSKAIDVYSSLALQGASKDTTAGIVNGIKLSLAQHHGKAGRYPVTYTSLDDSTAQTGAWDPGQTAGDARKVIQDSKAVAYIGEYNSGASAISIPLLNQAGIGQISPTNTYVGLTASEPGSGAGEPAKYYPTGKRTFVRIVPRDTIQGTALLTVMREDGCRNAAVANDRDTFGIGLGQVLEQQAKATGFKLLSNTGIQKDAPNFRAYAASLQRQNADCFVFAGVTANGAVQLMKDVAAALPNAKLYGPDGTCESDMTNPSKGGMPTSVGKRFKCTVAVRDLNAYPGGKSFLAAYGRAYGGSNPDPYAIYGYESMNLVLDTLAKSGPDRAKFVADLFATKNRQSVLGTYSIDQNGDTSDTDYGVYDVGPSGDPQFIKTIGAKPST